MLPSVTPSCLPATLLPMLSAVEITFFLKVAEYCFRGPDILTAEEENVHFAKRGSHVRTRVISKWTLNNQRRNDVMAARVARVARASIVT